MYQQNTHACTHARSHTPPCTHAHTAKLSTQAKSDKVTLGIFDSEFISLRTSYRKLGCYPVTSNETNANKLRMTWRPCTCHGFTNKRTPKGTDKLTAYDKTTGQRLPQNNNRHVSLEVSTGQSGEPGILYDGILTFLFPCQLVLKHF